MEKIIRTVMSPEAKESWDELNKVVSEEIEKGIENSFNQQLFKSIKRIKELSIILIIRAIILSEFSNKTILFFIAQLTELSIIETNKFLPLVTSKSI